MFPMTLWFYCDHQETLSLHSCPPQLRLGRHKNRQVPDRVWRGLDAFLGGVRLTTNVLPHDPVMGFTHGCTFLLIYNIHPLHMVVPS